MEYLWLPGGKDSREREGEWDRNVHTALFKRDNQQGPTVYQRALCSVLGGSLVGMGVWERKDTYIRMAESLCHPPEAIATLLIGYTPI